MNVDELQLLSTICVGITKKAGLSCFGSAGCLTELGIVHQGVAHQ
jgi:hypothetical protein